VPAAWQRPYLNIFKHFRVEEWKRSTREGDVAAITDARLKGTVYRIRGSLPTSSYLQLPRTGTQSLRLVGRYLYLLFRPMPYKHFIVHLDVTTEENQVVRISFSTLFKEFKSTATWLQFPFVCGAAEDSVDDCPARRGEERLARAAPADVRWTCLVLDLHSILSLYLSRRYSHLKSVKLCSNLLVKNLCTSDLVFDPGEELGPRVAFVPSSELPSGVCRCLCNILFTWYLPLILPRFPSEESKLPYDSIWKSCPTPMAALEDPIHQLPQPVTLTKAVQDRLSLIQQITSPKAVSAPW
ncbi:WDR90 protein, partial [Todus mexicanus]|nr:WDR90 protein [Todus mexicanus]